MCVLHVSASVDLIALRPCRGPQHDSSQPLLFVVFGEELGESVGRYVAVLRRRFWSSGKSNVQRGVLVGRRFGVGHPLVPVEERVVSTRDAASFPIVVPLNKKSVKSKVLD